MSIELNTAVEAGTRSEDGEEMPAADSARRGQRTGGLPRGELLRLAHQLFAVSDAPRSIVFCSAEEDESCGWVCAGTAEALAGLTTRPICVVDANFAAPSVHVYFAIDKSPGLSNLLVEAGSLKDFAKPVRGEHLWAMPCGRALPEPAVLCFSDAFRSRMEELRTEFDFVLINGGRGQDYPGAAQFAPAADGAVLIVKANSTRREEAIRVKQTLAAVNLAMLGAVLVG